MHLLKNQELLIERFLLEPSKMLSVNSINRTINNIKFHLPDEPKLHISQLMEYGILDIIDRKYFRLSASSLIIVNNKLISVNIPINLVDKYVVKELVYKTIYLLDIKHKSCIEKSLNLKIKKIEPLYLLKKIPPLKNIIENFKKIDIYEFKKFKYFNPRNLWDDFGTENLLGCYKAGEEGFHDKYIRISKNDWYLIPDTNIHPDAFLLAVKYSDILTDRFKGLEYNSLKKELRCTNHLFPSVLKRIINLNACFDVDNIILEKNHTIYKNVEYSFYRTLNKIFMKKVKNYE